MRGASFPYGAAGSSGPCVPKADALGPPAVHGWPHAIGSHPQSARRFLPVTTGCGSLRITRAEWFAYVTLSDVTYSPCHLLTVDPGTVKYALDVCDVCAFYPVIPGTPPPTRVDGTDVTMDHEVPYAGTPMAVPITCRLMRAAVDTDASIRCPMSRAADHRSDKKGSRMDGHNVPSWHK
jgi:hypothetical protein